MKIDAIIFDLDGVIVSTDEYHYRAWKRLADEQGIDFDRTLNHRLRGVSRRESLMIILEQAGRRYSEVEIVALMERKNRCYRDLLECDLSDGSVLPGVDAFLASARHYGLKTAIASSSRNTPLILQRIGMTDRFDAIADGNDIARSKPDPEVFLLAADRLGVKPERCLVVEDAAAGIEAALRAGMLVLAVGHASADPRAHFQASGLNAISLDEALTLAPA